jgi:hypothetical protein
LTCIVRTAPVNRINVICHGDIDFAGFTGSIGFDKEKQNYNVYFSKPFTGENSTGISIESLQELQKLEESHAKFKLNAGSEKNPKFKQYTLGDIRKMLSTDAFIVLYACHAGASRRLLEAIKNTFGRTAIGFNQEIWYDLDINQGTIMSIKVGPLGSTYVSDFHDIPLESQYTIRV